MLIKNVNVFISFISFFFTWPLFSFFYFQPAPIIHHLTQLSQTMSSEFEEVDCIYVINLDKRKDRWEQIQKIFAPYKLVLNRVSALNGWELKELTKKEIEGPYPRRLSGGQMGCLLSHLSVLQDALKKGYEVIWVLEDDVEILGNLESIPKIMKQLKNFDPDWHILFTDLDQRITRGTYSRLMLYPRKEQVLQPASYYRNREHITKDLVKIHWRLGAHSILYSRQGIQKIFDYLTHTYPWVPFDIDIHYIDNIREYALSKPVVANGLNRADSDTEREFNNLRH